MSQFTNKYRVYVLDTTVATAPVVTVAHIFAAKYGDAWKGARANLNGTDPKEHSSRLFSDAEGKVPLTVSGPAFTVAKVDDLKPKNVKVDKTALQTILDDPKATPEAKIAAMRAQLGPAAKTPAPAQTAAS